MPAAGVAGPSPRGSCSPTGAAAMPARLLSLGLGPSGPQDRGSTEQGRAPGKVAGEGRGRGQVPPSHRRHQTCRAVRAPVGPWELRGLCPGRRHHPTRQGGSLCTASVPLFFPVDLSSPPTRPGRKGWSRAPPQRAPISARPPRGARVMRHKSRAGRAGGGGERND